MSKKKIPWWGWLGTGCAALMFTVGVVVVAGGFFVAGKVKDFAEEFEGDPARMAAELVVRANPELEMVDSDEDAGTMTIR